MMSEAEVFHLFSLCNRSNERFCIRRECVFYVHQPHIFLNKQHASCGNFCIQLAYKSHFLKTAQSKSYTKFDSIQTPFFFKFSAQVNFRCQQISCQTLTKMKRVHEEEGKRELLNLPEGVRENMLDFLGEKKQVPMVVDLTPRRQFICLNEGNAISMTLQYAVCDETDEPNHERRWKTRAVNYISKDMFPSLLFHVVARCGDVSIKYPNTMCIWQWVDNRPNKVTQQQLEDGPLKFFGKIGTIIPSDAAEETCIELCPWCYHGEDDMEEEEEEEEEVE